MGDVISFFLAVLKFSFWLLAILFLAAFVFVAALHGLWPLVRAFTS